MVKWIKCYCHRKTFLFWWQILCDLRKSWQKTMPCTLRTIFAMTYQYCVIKQSNASKFPFPSKMCPLGRNTFLSLIPHLNNQVTSTHNGLWFRCHIQSSSTLVDIWIRLSWDCGGTPDGFSRTLRWELTPFLRFFLAFEATPLTSLVLFCHTAFILQNMGWFEDFLMFFFSPPAVVWKIYQRCLA